MKIQMGKSILSKMASELKKASLPRSGAALLGAGHAGLNIVFTASRWLVCQGLAHLLLVVEGRNHPRTARKG